MIHIGKSYIQRTDNAARLCADITIGNHRNTLWFSVDSSQRNYLAVGRADAFVMCFLSAAMRDSHEIVCEDPMSERLHYQLNNYLIPALAFAGKRYHFIHITAPLTSRQYPNMGVTGSAYSSGVDSFYTIMMHGKGCENPISHIMVYNCSHYDQFGAKREQKFLANCRQAIDFAREYGLYPVIVDTNINELLGKESRLNVGPFRNVACTLALQGLLSCYLLSSAYGENAFSLHHHNLDETHDGEKYNRLTVASCGTESLSFYLSGSEVKRWQKIERLTHWEPSGRWLHPCWIASADKMNCGRCGKCICDLAVLYALGSDELNKYSRVYPIEDFLNYLPQRIAYLMTYASLNNIRAQDALAFLESSGAFIPPESYVYAEQFRKAAYSKNDSHRGDNKS